MTDDEAQQTGEFNMRHSHATHDLYNAIADGNYPVWDLHIQTLDPADEDKLDFDPLDCTKVLFVFKACTQTHYCVGGLLSMVQSSCIDKSSSS